MQVGSTRYRDLARHCEAKHSQTDHFHVAMYQQMERREEVPPATTTSQTASSATTGSLRPDSITPAAVPPSQQKKKRTSPRRHSQPAAQVCERKREREELAPTPRAPLPKKQCRRRCRSPALSSSSTSPCSTPPRQASLSPLPSSTAAPATSTPESTSPERTTPATPESTTPVTTSPEAPAPITPAAPPSQPIYEDITPTPPLDISRQSEMWNNLFNTVECPQLPPLRSAAHSSTSTTPPQRDVQAAPNHPYLKHHRATQTESTVWIANYSTLDFSIHVLEPNRVTDYRYQHMPAARV